MSNVNAIRIDARYQVLLILRKHNIQASEQIMKEIATVIDQAMEAQSVVVLQEVERMMDAENMKSKLARQFDELERQAQIHNNGTNYQRH